MRRSRRLGDTPDGLPDDVDVSDHGVLRLGIREKGGPSFRVYRGFYAYDKIELKATVESVQETENWRREKVSFDAAYGRERVPGYLFLPRNARPPYQTVMYWPAGEATVLRSSEDMRLRFIEFLLRSGRAVLCPVYKSTYERRPRGVVPPVHHQDRCLHAGREVEGRGRAR
jgi:hypothetical protein